MNIHPASHVSPARDRRPRVDTAERREPKRYELSSPVVCADGWCGELARVVVDRVTHEVTHLIVEPHGRHALARLVPLDLDDAHDAEIHLRCTQAQWRGLEYAQEVEFLAADPSALLAFAPGWPYPVPAPWIIVHEQVPLGEVEIRRGDRLHAANGAIGHVHGLFVDPQEHHLTHVLVRVRRLTGAKDVAVPITALDHVDDDGVHASLDKRAIADLPAVPVASGAAR